MPDYPTATAAAAPLHGLETAIRALGDGIVERRVRRQFHQLLAALEHDGIINSPAPLFNFFDVIHDANHVLHEIA
jgi:hypothetical protein